MTRQRGWVCTIGFGGVAGVAVAVGWLLAQSPTSLGPLPATDPALTEFVLAQLQQEVGDRKAWDRRFPGGHLSIDALLPGSVLKRRYHVQYGREKLLCSGRAVIPVLMKVTADPALNSDLREEASIVLSYFEDPRINEAIRSGKLDVPIMSWSYSLTYGVFIAKNPDPVKELDRVVEEGCDVGASISMVRWLNRLYGQDLDDWLARVAPNALRFRNAQLAKGYDPAIAFRRIAGMKCDRDAIDALFSRPEDREGCVQLLSIVYGAELLGPERYKALNVLPTVGWEDRLRAWYKENRSHLVYDMEKHRFVVRRPGAETSSAPYSQPAGGSGIGSVHP